VKLLFRNGRIVDGLGGVFEKGWVLVKQGRIEAVGRGAAGAAEGREDAEVVDLEGRTLLPGLIDCHVHLVLDGGPDPMTRAVQSADAEAVLGMAANGVKTLKAGFTAVRDLGSKSFIDVHLRNAVEAGLVQGPRIACSGQMICITGGHGSQMGCVADGPDGVRRAVRIQAGAGVDWVKLMATGGVLTRGGVPGMPHLNPEELRAGVEEAHKLHLRTSAHSQSLEGSRNAIRAGIDCLEHGVGMDQEIVEEMVKKGVYLVPTLSAPANIIARGERAGIPVEFVDKTRRLFDDHVAGFQLAARTGVKIAMGTDAGTPFNLHGENARELVLMAEHGMPAEEAVRSATSRAAELLGLEESLGSIAVGKRADLLVVEGNPLEDLSVCGDPVAVFRAGERVDERPRNQVMESRRARKNASRA
jgi:imidazolonepropionase-like amidohydrolase